MRIILDINKTCLAAIELETLPGMLVDRLIDAGHFLNTFELFRRQLRSLSL